VIDMTDNNTPSPVITHYPDAPIPTRLTRMNRQNPLVQVPKFIGLSASIVMMVLKGHQD